MQKIWFLYRKDVRTPTENLHPINAFRKVAGKKANTQKSHILREKSENNPIIYCPRQNYLGINPPKDQKSFLM